MRDFIKSAWPRHSVSLSGFLAAQLLRLLYLFSILITHSEKAFHILMSRVYWVMYYYIAFWRWMGRLKVNSIPDKWRADGAPLLLVLSTIQFTGGVIMDRDVNAVTGASFQPHVFFVMANTWNPNYDWMFIIKRVLPFPSLLIALCNCADGNLLTAVNRFFAFYAWCVFLWTRGAYHANGPAAITYCMYRDNSIELATTLPYIKDLSVKCFLLMNCCPMSEIS